MGGGSLLQLAMAGQWSEQHVINNADVSLFRTRVRRHTPFSLETYRLEPETQVYFNERTAATYRFIIKRHGDLLTNALLSFRLPAVYSSENQKFRWIPYIGLFAVEYVSLLADGQVVDRMYPEMELARRWLERGQGGDLATYEEMVGHVRPLVNPILPTPITTYSENRVFYTWYPDKDAVPEGTPSLPSRRVQLPIGMFFSRHAGAALPLVALQASELSFEVRLRPWSEIFQVWRDDLGRYGAPPSGTNLSDFVREKVPVEIDAVMYAEYAFVSQDERRALATATQLDYLVDTTQRDMVNGVQTGTYEVRLPSVSKMMVWVLRHPDAKELNRWARFDREDDPEGLDTLDECGLYFNAVSREEPKPGWFYNRVHPFQRTGSGLPPGMYGYSFALNPMNAEIPTGASNLASLSRLQMRLRCTPPSGENAYDLVAFSVSMNIFRVSSGQGMLAYVQ